MGFQKGNKYGGSRANAGRKPDLLKAEMASFFERMAPLADGLIEQALTDPKIDWKTRMQAIETVYAYRYGRPRQQITLGGRMEWVGVLPQAAVDAATHP